MIHKAFLKENEWWRRENKDRDRGDRDRERKQASRERERQIDRKKREKERKGQGGSMVSRQTIYQLETCMLYSLKKNSLPHSKCYIIIGYQTPPRSR
jgi:hypothetical protein